MCIRLPRACRSVFPLMLGLLGACSPKVVPPEGTAVIGAAGGTVSSGGTTVVVPPGALGQDVKITVTPQPQAPVPSGLTTVGTPYTLGPEGQQFDVPVAVTLAVDPSKIPAGHSLTDVVVFTAPAGSTTFVALATTRPDATHVSALTNHFSTFVPGLQAAIDGGDQEDGGTQDRGGPDGGQETDAGAQDGGEPDGGAADAGDGGSQSGPLDGAWVVTGKNCNGTDLDISGWPTTTLTIAGATGQFANSYCTIPISLSYPSASEVNWVIEANSCGGAGDQHSATWAINGNTLTLTEALTPADEYGCGSGRQISTLQRP